MTAPQYLMLEDFASGIDLRKSVITTKPGALRVLTNGFVTAGGEIEKRRRFQLLGVMPNNTVGLGAVDNVLYTFGTAADVTPPAPVLYHRLIPTGGGVTITRVLDVDVFNAKLFVIARFSDNSVRRFYDGAQVSGTFLGGSAARTYRSKVYTVDGPNLRFSQTNDAANWSGLSSGIIDTTSQDAGSPDLIGLEAYYNSMALLGRRSIQIWNLDPDPAQNNLVQILANIGLVAPGGAARYGNGDVIFLSDTGLRSLRARDSSNAAALNDIGSPIDPIIALRRLSMSPSDAERIRALVEPVTGHFWLVWGSTVYALSFYPATKVTAWSTYELPFVPEYAVSAGTRVAIREGDNIYVYGGFQNAANALDNYVPTATLENEYDNSTVIVETPMLDFGRAATTKQFMGLDMACEGTWQVFANFDPLAPGAWSPIATVNQTTYSLARIPIVAAGTHIALRFVSTNNGLARIGAAGIHFSFGDAS